jgi:hypothetical protein
VTAPAVWKTGLAEVRSIKGIQVMVACPHCFGIHTHARSLLGSAAVVAGCHAGRSRCREYSVPLVASPRPSRSARAA